MSSVIPPTVFCCHSLLYIQAPGHVSHCRCATRYENVLLSTYLEYRHGVITEDEYWDISNVGFSKTIANARTSIDGHDKYAPKILPARMECWQNWKIRSSGSSEGGDEDEKYDYRTQIDGERTPVGWTAKEERWWMRDDVEMQRPRKWSLRWLWAKLRR